MHHTLAPSFSALRERAREVAGETQFAHHPDSPSTLHVRVGNRRAVKVDDFTIQVVDDIDLGGLLGKEQRRAFGKRFVVEMVRRN